MITHLETSLTELRAIAAPILETIRQIENAQADAEALYNLDTVDLHNEKALIALFNDAAQRVARLSNSPELATLPRTLGTIYQNLGQRSQQVTQYGDALRRADAQAAQKQAADAALVQQQAEQKAAFDAETQAMKQRLGLA